MKHGYISVTPITLDMTNYSFLSHLHEWGFDKRVEEHVPQHIPEHVSGTPDARQGAHGL